MLFWDTVYLHNNIPEAQHRSIVAGAVVEENNGLVWTKALTF